MLNIFNLFSDGLDSHHSKIFLRLYSQSIQLAGKESELIFESKDRIEKAYWIYEDYFFENDNNNKEYYSIRSVDENIKFNLCKNLRTVKIEYPCIINESHGNFSYVKTVKFFPLKSLPLNWRVPLQLLIKYFKLNLGRNNIERNFNNEVEDITTISPEFTIKKSIEFFNFLTLNPLAMKYNLKNYSKEKSSLIKLTYDEVNPIAFIFNSESQLEFLYTRNFTYLITQDSNQHYECEILNNEHPQLINYSSNSISILYYQAVNSIVHSIEIEKYLQLLIECGKNTIDLKNLPEDIVNEMIFELSDIRKNIVSKSKWIPHFFYNKIT